MLLLRNAVAGQDLVIHLAGNVGGIGYNREHPGELTLVAVGPLTNVALALRRDPSLTANLDQVRDAMFRMPAEYETPVLVSVLVLTALLIHEAIFVTVGAGQWRHR